MLSLCADMLYQIGMDIRGHIIHKCRLIRQEYTHTYAYICSVLESILNTKYLKYYFKYFPCICIGILNTVIKSI